MSGQALLVLLLAPAAALHVGGGLRLRQQPSPHVRAGCISCGWGPEPVWSPHTVATICDAASGLKALPVDAPAAAAGYAVPGQYVQIREPGAEKASFFAIASAPGNAGAFEFLIKEQPPSEWSPGTGWLTGAPAGTNVEMSQVMGGGFNLGKEGHGLDAVDSVLLFAAGSGIAPIRSAIESGQLARKDVTLYYGCATEAQMAYADKFSEWEKACGCKVVPVLSKPGAGWSGVTGYVQDVAAASGVPSPGSTLVLMCGMKGMAEGVKALASEVGIPEERVLANF